MIRIAFAAALIAAVPATGMAATVSLQAIADGSVPGETTNVIDSRAFDTATDQLGFVAAEVAPATGEGLSRSNAHFDFLPGTMHASSTTVKNAGTGSSVHFSSANAGHTETYVADGDGSVTVRFGYAGRLDLTTDIPDASRLVRAFAGLNIFAPTLTESRFSDSAFFPDPLFGATNGFFDDEFIATFNVSDGDDFRVNPYLGVETGALEQFSAFIDASAEINGFWSIEATGTVLTSSDGTLIPTTPVPLPAGVMLLLTPLGALVAMRRPKRA